MYTKRQIIIWVLGFVGMMLFSSGKTEKRQGIRTGIYVKYFPRIEFDSLGNLGLSKTRQEMNLIYLAPDSTFAFAYKFYPDSPKSTWNDVNYGIWATTNDSLLLYIDPSSYWTEILFGRELEN